MGTWHEWFRFYRCDCVCVGIFTEAAEPAAINILSSVGGDGGERASERARQHAATQQVFVCK